MVWKSKYDQGSSKAGGFAFTSASSSNLSYLSEIPSFTAISDANLIVAFKNLLKKDTNTKTKALEDILAFAQSRPHEDGGVEDAMLEAWVGLYPRASIDNARRVRELSHTVQLALLQSARKRMERHIPTVVGPWLAGLYDRDRSVARTARDGLSTFLTTPDKWNQFWKRCRGRILDYVTDALAETPETLSDERTTSKEDAESKAARVRAGTLCLVCGLIEHAREDLDTVGKFASVIGSDKVWTGAADADAGVRRAACQLATTCIDCDVASLGQHIAQVKSKFVLEGLKQPHVGSAGAFLAALQALQTKYPEIWSSVSGKEGKLVKAVLAFIEKGSRGGGSAFWGNLAEVVTRISPLSDSGNRGRLLATMRAGLTRKDEPRSNVVPAWTAYLEVVDHFVRQQTSLEDQAKLVQENVVPLFDARLCPGQEESSWKITNEPCGVLTIAYRISASACPDMLSAHLEDLAAQTRQLISASLPEVSAEYQSSQQKVVEAGSAWLEVAAAAQVANEDGPIREPSSSFERPVNTILNHCIDVLTRRKFKPWGAASLLAFALSPDLKLGASNIATVTNFFEDLTGPEIQAALASPAAPHLFKCLKLLASVPSPSVSSRAIWSTWTEAAIKQPHDQLDSTALESLLACRPSSVEASNDIQDFLLSACIDLVPGRSQEWTIGEASIRTGVLSTGRLAKIVQACLNALQEGHADSSVRMLHAIAVHAPTTFALDADTQTSLLTSLLRFNQGGSPTKSRVATINQALNSAIADSRPFLTIIWSSLETVDAESIDVDVLFDLAVEMLGAGAVSANELLPSLKAWQESIEAVLSRGVDLAAGVASPLEGAFPLIEPTTPTASLIPTDRTGASVAARIATYVTRLVEESVLDIALLPANVQAEVYYLLLLTMALARDQLLTSGVDGLWKCMTNANSRSQAENLLKIQTIVSNVHSDKHTDHRWVVESLRNKCLHAAGALTPIGLYSADALKFVAGLFYGAEHDEPSSTIEERYGALDIWKATPSTLLPACGLLEARRQYCSPTPPKYLANLTNRLISDVAVAKVDDDQTMLSLVLLNSCLGVFEGRGGLPVANNRVVFAVRQLTSWVDADLDSVGPHLATQMCKALARLLVGIKDVYGPHWERAAELCFSIWGKANRAPPELIATSSHAAVNLWAAFTQIADPNDDLAEVLANNRKRHAAALVSLLKMSRETSDNRLIRRLDDSVCKEIRQVQIDYVLAPDDFFGLLSSANKDIQTTAFWVLTKALPEVQQQLAVDAALDKTEVGLPDELISLLLNAPTLEQYPDEEVLASFPAPISSYLLAWLLVFDTIESAPYRIRSDYVDHLRREQRLEALLTFAADVLGHTATPPSPLDLDKVGITPEMRTRYNPDDPEDDNTCYDTELRMDWLLVHLVFRAVKLVPNMFRAWLFNNVRPGTKICMSAWVSKYLTPHLIAAVLDDVTAWSESLEPVGDEPPLVVKTNLAGSAVTAGYEVDGQLACIGVQFPATYPLDLVEVQMRNQVVGSEKQWATWLKVTEGLIAGSNGNVIDGLLAFKRNISGALRGQDECAICYAIVASDKRLPDMRCGTCKHTFHRVCLYKWFQTSNQNTCPLCRTEMNWLGTRPERGGRNRERA